ncbi:phage holin family protein [Streptomyces sp. NPDC087297]|uniref:phage holin family protein n=1 Tax=Streptomyces sp. NPDC087297 TaxID=3365778 RepID=UPI0037F8456A
MQDSVSVSVPYGSRRIAEPVRTETQPARAAMDRKRNRVGTAGVLGLFAAQVLMATCIAAVALFLPVGVAALTITGVLAAAAAAAGLAGRPQVADLADLAELPDRAHR